MNTQTNFFRSLAEATLFTVLLLSVPFIASYFTDEVVWSASDYIVAGILLFGTGLTYKLIADKTAGTAYKAAVGIALFTGLFLIWSNLAVGIIGSEDNTFNLIYFGIPLIGIIGAIIVRFKAEGLAKTMFTLCFAHMLVTVIALITGMHQVPDSSVMKVLIVNAFFIFLFGVSALLFRYAALPEATNNEQEV